MSERAPSEPADYIVTGADAAFFINSRMLIASWWEHNRDIGLLFCDYGLTDAQRAELALWPIRILPRPAAFEGHHPWRDKAGLVRYLDLAGVRWRNLVWIDADATFLRPLPPLSPLMAGYDLLVDAHPQAIGEIVAPERLAMLPLDPSDAYIAAGFWIASSRTLLEAYDRLVEPVEHLGGLWEGDAFVAAVYSTKARIRTVCGQIWHVRGKTSLETVVLEDGVLAFAGQPAFVLHANARYVVRADGRRVFTRDILSAVQDRYEQSYAAALAGHLLAAGAT